MTVRQLIPEDLAEVSPGPELARILGGIELSRLSGHDCVEVLKTQYRQVNHERARLMTTMVEVGLCDIGPDDELPRKAVPGEFAADEVRAALMLTRRAADTQFWLAHDLLTRLPAVHAAMDARGAGRAPCSGVLGVDRGSAPGAGSRAGRGVAAAGRPADHGPAHRTDQETGHHGGPGVGSAPLRAGRGDRKVVGYRNPDGSANLSGCNLPVHRVAAASGHIDALAKAVKRAGDGRPIDHLFLGMTDGTYSGLDDAEIINQLLAAGDVGESVDPSDRHHDDARSGVAPSASQGSSGPVVSGGAGMELRVRLSTLLGQDQYPAELAGWGPVHAELARDLATTLGGAEWRFAITDEHGQLTHCGITRSRPTGTPTRMAGCSAIVELALPATNLHALRKDLAGLGGWAEVVADLLRQMERGIVGDGYYASETPRRAPGAGLRRYLEIRDRSCTMIGCRAPARTADKDHTVDHSHGGPTAGPNLGDACRHDHRLKHEGGWRLHQSQPGHFHWTSRLGHHYHRRPPPILEPLPDPIPRNQPPIPLLVPVDADWEASEIWVQPPPGLALKPQPPESVPSDDLPPF